MPHKDPEVARRYHNEWRKRKGPDYRKQEWAKAAARTSVQRKEERQKRIAAGICERCGQNQARPNRTSCEPCGKAFALRQHERYVREHPDYGTSRKGVHRKKGTRNPKSTYYRREAKHLCRRCAIALPQDYTFVTCAGCRERARLEQKEYISQNPDHWVWRKYGITKTDWDRMFLAQGKCCAICRRTIHGGRGWCTDHDHDTKEVRGILCHTCNAGLGHYGDSPDLLEKAARYLRAFKPRTVTKIGERQLTLIRDGG